MDKINYSEYLNSIYNIYMGIFFFFLLLFLLFFIPLLHFGYKCTNIHNYITIKNFIKYYTIKHLSIGISTILIMYIFNITGCPQLLMNLLSIDISWSSFWIINAFSTLIVRLGIRGIVDGIYTGMELDKTNFMNNDIKDYLLPNKVTTNGNSASGSPSASGSVYNSSMPGASNNPGNG